MTTAATSPRWASVCPGCGRDAELESREEHGLRALCDTCAARPNRPAAAAAPESSNGAAPRPAAASSLEQRLADSRVDLLAYLENGMPERAWLPQSERMLARGKRHHVAAPLKSGKSIGFLVHAVDMVIADARVVILDRENGADEYARRLRDILADRPLIARDAIRERLAYYAWPAVKLTDGQDLAAALNNPDVVILDSTRTFLSALALDENASDDFAKFAAAIVDPLFRAGIATVQLDNTGHGDTGRARGSSSKGDLADVLYSLKTTQAFDGDRRGRLRLTRTHSRLGDVAPAFGMELGGGHFGTFTADHDHRDPGPTTFRPTFLMERVSRALEQTAGLSKNTICGTVKGKKEHIATALELLIADGYIRIETDGQTHHHHVIQPYRETHETTHQGTGSQPGPNRVPDPPKGTGSPGPPPKGDPDPGPVEQPKQEPLP